MNCQPPEPYDPSTWYKKYKVQAASVADFLDRYYKTNRYYWRGVEYAALLLKRYEKEFADQGYVFISRHDSKTGEIVSYF